MNSSIETYTSRILALREIYDFLQTTTGDSDFYYLEQSDICDALLEMIQEFKNLECRIAGTLKRGEERMKHETFGMHMPLSENGIIEFFLTKGFIDRAIKTNVHVSQYRDLQELFLEKFDDIDFIDNEGKPLELGWMIDIIRNFNKSSN